MVIFARLQCIVCYAAVDNIEFRYKNVKMLIMMIIPRLIHNIPPKSFFLFISVTRKCPLVTDAQTHEPRAEAEGQTDEIVM